MKRAFESKKENFSIIKNLVAGLCALLFLVAVGLFIVLIFKPLYYFEISYLDLVKTSGYAKEEILLNYNALIDWCMPWVQSEFSLPTFPSSQNAVTHFEEVKGVFNFLFSAGTLSFVVFLFLINRTSKSKRRQRLYFSGGFVLFVPAFLGLYAASNFNRAFVLFHEIVFRNELWIFDYKTDPVITILPEAYFMHCTIAIFAIILLGSLGLFALGRRSDL
ncbi:MAG: TIGR01906 family membrane protein [Clostridia bacterium]|nr:TIGR01906 family membrane protein [Clostridia bacterium]